MEGESPPAAPGRPPIITLLHRLRRGLGALTIGALTVIAAIVGPLIEWPYWPWCAPVGVVLVGLALIPWAHERVERNVAAKAQAAQHPAPISQASPTVPSADAREQAALSVTSEMGRDKRPGRAYFAAHLDTGKMWLQDATNPEPFGGPPSHTLADQAYGTWTVYNDAARPAINVHLSFAYQWQRMGHTEALSLGRTVGITVPRIDGKSHVVIRIGNFTTEYVLHISPTPNCAFEAPGDTSQHPCILQGANPARRENILTLFPAARNGQHAHDPSGIIESAHTPSDMATATFRNVKTGETHSVSSLGIASDQEQTEYLLNLIDLYAQSRNTERGWLSSLLDPAMRIGAPFPPRDKQYDYPRAIKLLEERGLVRILDTRKREYVDMIGLSIHEDFEFERLDRLAKKATTPPAPVERTSPVAKPSPPVIENPDAHAVQLGDQLIAFLARRRGYHPNGPFAAAFLETGPVAQLMSRFFASQEWWDRAAAYDTETLQQYLSRYARAVREAREAIVKPHALPDPTMDALIFDQPRLVVEIVSIATYLRALAGIEAPRPPSKAPSTTTTSQDAMAARLTELVGAERANLKKRVTATMLRLANMRGDYHYHEYQADQHADEDFGRDIDWDRALRDEAVKIAQAYASSDLDDEIRTLVADCKRIGIVDLELDAILAKIRPLNKLVRMEQLADVENHLALLPGKIDALA